MSAVEFLQAHVKNTLGSNVFEPNQERKVLPMCKTPTQGDVENIDDISIEEKTILDKVYQKVIESLEQLNNKKEEHIINELNSFHNNQI